MLTLEDDVDFYVNIKGAVVRFSILVRNNPLRLQPPSAEDYDCAAYGLNWTGTSFCSAIAAMRRIPGGKTWTRRGRTPAPSMNGRIGRQFIRPVVACFT
jgi:hypothetical protein